LIIQISGQNSLFPVEEIKPEKIEKRKVNGAASVIRTRDLTLTKGALYRWSYGSTGASSTIGGSGLQEGLNPLRTLLFEPYYRRLAGVFLPVWGVFCMHSGVRAAPLGTPPDATERQMRLSARCV
jgi:hypothetical protein|tara:strand:+ start:2328 stop:2702 length:375 start_codon:yes stop_codon:yes gene_type:complete